MDDEEEVGNVGCEHDSESDEGNCEDTEDERDNMHGEQNETGESE
jgi:hypothetical protein